MFKPIQRLEVRRTFSDGGSRLVGAIFLLLLCNSSFACYKPPVKIAELNGQPIERIMSQNGKFLLEMHPAKWSKKDGEFIELKKSLGIIYNVSDDGQMTFLWQKKGIYPRFYQPGINPIHYEKLTHYLSSNGTKVIRILDKGWRSKSIVTVLAKSGILKEIKNDQLKGKVLWGCGVHIIESHRATTEDNIELNTIGTSSWPQKEWLLSIQSGELKRIH